jgi:hypothetical protein
MNHYTHKSLLAAVLVGWAGLGVVQGQDQGELARLRTEKARLQIQNANLQESLIEANRREKDSATALAQIKLRLEALGKNLIDSGDDRQVKAVADMAVLDRRLRKLEEAAIRLSASVQGYLKTAIASDPEARAQVEARLRELEVELGLRNLPDRNIERGNLQHAKVKSIDEKSGLVVLNVGDKEKARIGMIFNIMRGDQVVAEAMVAETRPDICGVFVQRLENENNPVRFNDTASLKTN